MNSLDFKNNGVNTLFAYLNKKAYMKLRKGMERNCLYEKEKEMSKEQ